MMIWSIPVFVDASAFASAYYERELATITKCRAKVGFVSCVALGTVVMAIIVAFTLIGKAQPERLLASGAIFMTMMLSIAALHDTTVEALSERKNDCQWRLKKANNLLANSIYFGDDQKMWWTIQRGGQNPREEVYNWCVSNGIAATLAAYDDPMFGQFGMLVSMPDEDSMIFFKLKYMDRI